MKSKLMAMLLITVFTLLSACGREESTVDLQTNDFLSVYAESKREADELRFEASVTEKGFPESEEEQEQDSSDGLSDVMNTEDSLSETVSITISAAGDVTLGNYLGQDYSLSFRQVWDQSQDADYFLENVRDIFRADDLTLVNLEGPLTRAEEKKEEKTYCISGDPEYAAILTAGAVEAVSMANNHRLDYYDQGAVDTVKAVEEEGIVYAYDSIPGIYETKGIRIGYVAVDEISQNTGIEKIMEKGIHSLREEGADLILACCHWGIERENYPDDYQQVFGKKCIDWGADLVIGHHPHVLQGIEEYQGKYIVYSLGNFCFGANRNPKDKDSIIFQQTFYFMDGVRQEESEAKIIPCSISSVTDRNDYRPTPLSGEDAVRVINRMNEYSQPYEVQFDNDGWILR